MHFPGLHSGDLVNEGSRECRGQWSIQLISEGAPREKDGLVRALGRGLCLEPEQETALVWVALEMEL